MAIEMLSKYILCYAVLLHVFPTTFASKAFPPTKVKVVNGNYRQYKTRYAPPKSCDFSSPYRTIDGSCNNKDNPLLGRSFTPFKRFLGPDYHYVLYPDKWMTDSRDLSRIFFQENSHKSVEKLANHLFVTFGQFALHDVALAQTNRRNVRCCPNSENTTECMPDLFKDEPECNTHNPSCHSFTRNLGVGDLSGKYGDRQQLNRVTHYLDGSTIYGSTNVESKFLRERKTGKMKVTNIGNNPLLPTEKSIHPPNNCPFFRGGDVRVTAVITITTHHIFWVREHNYIVDGLRKLHPNWKGEKLFQEARKIVIAELQHITYVEFLPMLIGLQNMHKYKLTSTSKYEYKPKIDGSVSNAYTTAAFRHAHLMLDDIIFLDQKGRDSSRRNTTGVCRPGINSIPCNSTRMITLDEALASPDRLFSCENSLDSFIMGSIKQRAQIPNDMRVARSIKRLGGSLDLIGVDIERNRDHGIPSYKAWRDFCGLDTFTFDADSDTHKNCILRKLQSIYGTEDAIDLYVGASLENKLDGAVLGPTYACIIAEQMHDTKYGDRFWYQNDGQFTQDQLNEITSQTMSMILKRNTNILSVPVNPFVVLTKTSDFQTGDAAFNFSAWK